MKLIHPVSWVALAAAAAIASPSFAMRAPLGANVTMAAPDAPANFEVFLPLRNKAELAKLLAAQHTKGSPEYQKWLTPGEFAARFGPTAQSMARTQAAVAKVGLRVTDVHERSFHVTGTVDQVSKLFSVPMKSVQPANGPAWLMAGSKMLMPTVFQQEGARVMAFHGIPPHHVASQRIANGIAVAPYNRTSTEGGYYFDDLKQAYDYPSWQTMVTSAKTGGVPAHLDGTGVNVAIVMYDGIYAQDVGNIFLHENWTAVTGKPAPTVTSVSVDGGSTTTKGGGTDEASLDVQMVLGGAPGANVSLLDIPDLSDDSIMADYTYINTKNTFDVVNSSFGGCELFYTAAYNDGHDYTYILDAYDELFLQGNSQGVTFVASSGDEGGLLCPNIASIPPVSGLGANGVFVAGVSSPSDDPNVTSVGGGNLATTFTANSLNSAYVGENADGDPEIAYNYWGYTGCGTRGRPACPTVSGGYWGAGGGISSVFAQPAYQSANAGVNTGSSTWRTQPDVGMMVGGCPGGEAVTPCPQSNSEAGPFGAIRSYVVVAINSSVSGGVYKNLEGLIGTSVSSPEFVSSIALYVEATGHRQGNINYYLYHAGAYQTQSGGINAPAAQQFYHRNIVGFDGLYTQTTPTSAENYTYLDGNGTPDVRNLFGFAADAAAGVPQTPSNP